MQKTTFYLDEETHRRIAMQFPTSMSSYDPVSSLSSAGSISTGTSTSHQTTAPSIPHLPISPISTTNEPSPLYHVHGDQHTQFVRRLQSTRLPDDATPMCVQELDEHITRDLANSRVENAGSLVSTIFPDSTCFGFAIDFKFLESFEEVGLLTQGGFLKTAAFEREDTAATYLNQLILHFEKCVAKEGKPEVTLKRLWTAGYADTYLPADSALRKPDMALVEIFKRRILSAAAIRWPNIYAVGEITTRTGYHSVMKNTIATKSFLMLTQQADRNFSVCFGIHNKSFQFVVTDHQGEVRSQDLPFSNGSETTANFIRMIAALAFCDKELIGLDKDMERQVIPEQCFTQEPLVVPKPKEELVGKPRRTRRGARHMYTEAEKKASSAKKVNMKEFARSLKADRFTLYPYSSHFVKNHKKILDPEKVPNPPKLADIVDIKTNSTNTSIGEKECDIAFITCQGVRYIVVKEVFRAQSLVGRGTRVWLVLDSCLQLVILKQSWIICSRSKEAEFLNDLDIPNGIKCLASSVGAKTDAVRRGLKPEDLHPEQFREKRCIVTTRAGNSIGHFTSLPELIGAFLDVTLTLKYLEAQGRVHRDISFNNILLQHIGPGQTVSVGDPEIDSLLEKYRRGLLIDFDYAAKLLKTFFLSIPKSVGIPPARPSAAGPSAAAASPAAASPAAASPAAASPAAASPAAASPAAASPADPSAAASPGGLPPDVRWQNQIAALLAQIPTLGQSHGGRTGTAPFMALELLLHAPLHKTAHDLESLYYVLLYICTMLAGPNTLRNEDPRCQLWRPPSISEWFTNTGSFHKLGVLKWSHISKIETEIIPFITPYFYPLRDYLREMTFKLFPPRDPIHSWKPEVRWMEDRAAVVSPITCDDFIEIFKRMLKDDKITGHQPTTVGKRPAEGPADLDIFEAQASQSVDSGSSRSSKRSRSSTQSGRKSARKSGSRSLTVSQARSS